MNLKTNQVLVYFFGGRGVELVIEKILECKGFSIQYKAHHQSQILLKSRVAPHPLPGQRHPKGQTTFKHPLQSNILLPRIWWLPSKQVQDGWPKIDSGWLPQISFEVGCPHFYLSLSLSLDPSRRHTKNSNATLPLFYQTWDANSFWEQDHSKINFLNPQPY